MEGKKGLIIIISAPSGSGKTTLCKRLVRKIPNLYHSISTTTRPPRRGEVEKKDYFFVSREEFDRMSESGEFVEWARVFDEYYGTSRSFMEEMTAGNKDVLLSIDVQGAAEIKKSHPDAVSIFVLPPSMRALEERLRKRKTDKPIEISKRLKLARKEMERIEDYDYAVINRNIKTSLGELSAIITAEKCKVARSKEKIDGLCSS